MAGLLVLIVCLLAAAALRSIYIMKPINATFIETPTKFG